MAYSVYLRKHGTTLSTRESRLSGEKSASRPKTFDISSKRLRRQFAHSNSVTISTFTWLFQKTNLVNTLYLRPEVTKSLYLTMKRCLKVKAVDSCGNCMLSSHYQDILTKVLIHLPHSDFVLNKKSKDETISRSIGDIKRQNSQD